MEMQFSRDKNKTLKKILKNFPEKITNGMKIWRENEVSDKFKENLKKLESCENQFIWKNP